MHKVIRKSECEERKVVLLPIGKLKSGLLHDRHCCFVVELVQLKIPYNQKNVSNDNSCSENKTSFAQVKPRGSQGNTNRQSRNYKSQPIKSQSPGAVKVASIGSQVTPRVTGHLAEHQSATAVAVQ